MSVYFEPIFVQHLSFCSGQGVKITSFSGFDTDTDTDVYGVVLSTRLVCSTCCINI